ncbi:MAG: hypothetical protein IPK07_30625 [Deltaproteobacteria bacterium]|nr:hypothetical protein [Deltaproteobacteria bacterium]
MQRDRDHPRPDHGTSTYDWQNVPTVFNVGSPYYTSYNPTDAAHYTVFRITNDRSTRSTCRGTRTRPPRSSVPTGGAGSCR